MRFDKKLEMQLNKMYEANTLYPVSLISCGQHTMNDSQNIQPNKLKRDFQKKPKENIKKGLNAQHEPKNRNENRNIESGYALDLGHLASVSIETFAQDKSSIRDIKIYNDVTMKDIPDIHAFFQTFPIFLYKFLVITNADQLSINVSNALLKLFESNQENTFIFLITNNKDKLLSTIKSRCYIIDVCDYGSQAKDNIKNESKIQEKDRQKEVQKTIHEYIDIPNNKFDDVYQSLALHDSFAFSPYDQSIQLMLDFCNGDYALTDYRADYKLLLHHLMNFLHKIIMFRSLNDSLKGQYYKNLTEKVNFGNIDFSNTSGKLNYHLSSYERKLSELVLTDADISECFFRIDELKNKIESLNLDPECVFKISMSMIFWFQII